jgi:hypothetical protein
MDNYYKVYYTTLNGKNKFKAQMKECRNYKEMVRCSEEILNGDNTSLMSIFKVVNGNTDIWRVPRNWFKVKEN